MPYKSEGMFIFKWDSPYVVREAYINGAYKIVNTEGAWVGPMNTNFLKPYYPWGINTYKAPKHEPTLLILSSQSTTFGTQDYKLWMPKQSKILFSLFLFWGTYALVLTVLYSLWVGKQLGYTHEYICLKKKGLLVLNEKRHLIYLCSPDYELWTTLSFKEKHRDLSWYKFIYYHCST